MSDGLYRVSDGAEAVFVQEDGTEIRVHNSHDTTGVVVDFRYPDGRKHHPLHVVRLLTHRVRIERPTEPLVGHPLDDD